MRHKRHVAGCFAALCAVIGALVGCTRNDAPPVARKPFYAKAATVGTSMLPTFGIDETVLLELCEFSELRPGDTVIYWHAGISGYIHHRVFQRDELSNRWKTKGDNNAGMDTGLLTRDVFVGRTHKL